MLVSIITICYNRNKTIENCIKSVLEQDYPCIQYIIIDGKSNDGTVAIIESYADKITHFISEKDNGMYDALNKGLALATGDIVGLMHSDDVFYDTAVISKIVESFNNNPNADGLYGNGIYVTNDEKEKIVRNRIGGEYDYRRLKKGWLPLHPTVYIRKSIIDKFGNYDMNFEIASDTEFLLRYLFKYKIKMIYLNIYIVKMRMGGLSTTYKRAFQVLKEDYKIYNYHKISGMTAVFQKKVSALMQYLK
nr:glycosyltransferase family 2 protein [uncultured Flavobacterium sp.]